MSYLDIVAPAERPLQGTSVSVPRVCSGYSLLPSAWSAAQSSGWGGFISVYTNLCGAIVANIFSANITLCCGLVLSGEKAPNGAPLPLCQHAHTATAPLAVWQFGGGGLVSMT